MLDGQVIGTSVSLPIKRTRERKNRWSGEKLSKKLTLGDAGFELDESDKEPLTGR